VVVDSSSNWRELGNLVHSLKFLSKDHDIRGHKIFIFTDNSTAEASFWKGIAKSEKLFDLVLELKELELELGLMLHVIHISDRRMIVQHCVLGDVGWTSPISGACLCLRPDMGAPMNVLMYVVIVLCTVS
jgi:hypothetical protein